MSTTENMIVTENIGLKAPKEDAFYEVGYIAENNEIIDRKFADVGNLEDMNSEIGASTMVEALNLTFQSGNEKRGILASNLVAMGVEADASETWDILLPKVKDISTGVDTSNDTVVAEVLLEGYTAHDANQEQIVGTLPDKTGTEEYTATATLDSTNSELQMTIPAMGKYGTNNKLKATFAKIASLIGLTAAKLVKGNTILGITGNSNNMDTSVGTITSANQLLKGIIGCSDGKTYTGTVVDRRGTTVAATAVSQDDTYTYFKTPAGCYSEESMVRTENSNLTSEPELICNKSSTDSQSHTYTATKNGYALIVMLSCGQSLYCNYETYSHVKLNNIKVEEYLITSRQQETAGWKVYLVPVKKNDVVYALAQGPTPATERRLIIYQI